ncbi:MAG: UDP-4-amino-4,6-dideoxy-N-acetyl-beta-L-altrosamine transaminase [Candidatus Staskawiczbacteria bacterium]|nr:UDP-4-amino-4,6-dideoxy-N-acetyl-beta-L-altrosamine transaminase [Candidatus Staskawiczbacteria bacterium]
MRKIIPYGHQWIDNNDIEEVVKVLKSDWLTQGRKVEEFEKAVAKYCKAKYAVAVSSGSSALHSAYIAGGIKSGDEIITTPLTFAATSNMLVALGAKPVFVDVEKETLNINQGLIEKQITKKTKAIAVVDFAGHPADYAKIFRIAKKHKLLVIEDASHALGAEYKNKKIGGLADMTIFSFHPVKNITTGEGGMIATNSKDFYEKLKIIRNHGMVKKPEKGGWYYEIENPAFNYRITDIQCGLGLSQLKKINKFLKRRRDVARIYEEALSNIKEIIILKEKDYAKSAWHIYPVRLTGVDRKKAFEQLREMGIGVQVHYMPLHLHPFYKNKFGYKKGDFPEAEEYYERAITLPLFPKMTDKEVELVIKSVKKILNKK